ncbi:class I SAM-dependent methyltransferase [Echinicola shivajiensis]|uniref:class I SAM-dependent methyltransferase n=1 Tax=Echinicola shivajiensis TaxID=1035916 RepID=UPI001BFC2D7D|nr:class I SAM-dependent methyltransferase [Echinicola shivajiensis]
MEKNLYDRVVFFYDDLASLVLGKGHLESKRAFLDRITKGNNVLYIGGGTGTNLPEILEQVGEEGKVFFVEASQKMIDKAKKGVPDSLRGRVLFLKEDDFMKMPNHQFEIIITQFLLDLLTESDLEVLFDEVDKRCKRETKWIFTDFLDHPNRKILQYIMIWFFRLVTKNPRKDLPNYSKYFENYGWGIKSKMSFKKDWIQAWFCERTN